MTIIAFASAAAHVAAQGETPAKHTDENSRTWPFFERPDDSLLSWTLGDGARVRLEVGGSIREQFEGYRNFELGIDEGLRGWDRYLLHRLLVHADLTVDDRYRLFVELGNSVITGNARPAGPVDEDELYLHQVFGEASLAGALDAGGGASLKLGRQELSFGSGRLVSLRDGPNLRRSFDAARLALRGDGLEADLFFGAEVSAQPGNFDNAVDDDILFWGAYAAVEDVGGLGNLDVHYFGLDRAEASFDAGIADEERHSLGARLWGSVGRVDFNFEPVVQFGEFGDRDIRAWTLASDTGIRLGGGERAPHLGLRANVISGGHSEGELNTFNALFPNNSYFSEAAVFAPANLIDVNPTLTLSPREDVTVSAMWDHLWRFDTEDAVYVPPGVPILDGAATDERHMGHVLSLLAEWELSERTKVFGAFSHLEAGPAISGAGGGDVDYFLFGIDRTF